MADTGLTINIPVSAFRPSSVTDNLRGRYHTISGYEMFLEYIGHVMARDSVIPLKLSVTEDDLTAESGLTIKGLLFYFFFF